MKRKKVITGSAVLLAVLGLAGAVMAYFGASDDTENTVASGLRLRCDNREALTHQRVHQRGLAHIRVADDIYKSATMHSINSRPALRRQ